MLTLQQMRQLRRDLDEAIRLSDLALASHQQDDLDTAYQARQDICDQVAQLTEQVEHVLHAQAT